MDSSTLEEQQEVSIDQYEFSSAFIEELILRGEKELHLNAHETEAGFNAMQRHLETRLEDARKRAYDCTEYRSLMQLMRDLRLNSTGDFNRFKDALRQASTDLTSRPRSATTLTLTERTPDDAQASLDGLTDANRELVWEAVEAFLASSKIYLEI